MKKYLWTSGLMAILGVSLLYLLDDNRHQAVDTSDKVTAQTMTKPSVTSQSNERAEKKPAKQIQTDSVDRENVGLTQEQLALLNAVDVAIGVDDITLNSPTADEAFLNQVDAFAEFEESWSDRVASSSGIDQNHRPAGWQIVGVNHFDPAQTGIKKPLPQLQSTSHHVVVKVKDSARRAQKAQREAAFKEQLDNHPERQALHTLRQRLNQEQPGIIGNN